MKYYELGILLVLLLSIMLNAWAGIKASFWKSNKETIKKFLLDNAEVVYPRLNGPGVKRFQVWASETSNIFRNPHGKTGELIFYGMSLDTEMMKRAAFMQAKDPCYVIHPIAVMSVKTIATTATRPL